MPHDPIAIAQRLRAAGAERIVVVRAPREPGVSYVAANPDEESSAIDPFRPGADEPSAVPGWIGVLPYECFRGLERPAWSPPDDRPAATLSAPVWLHYPEVLRVDEASGAITPVGGDSLVAMARSRDAPASRAELEATDDEPLARHADRIRAAKELILRGDLYQVNLARRIRLRFRGDDPLDLHRRLMLAAAPEHGAYLELGGGRTVLSTSPELLLQASTKIDDKSASYERLFTSPIKGTLPRGRDEREDLELARRLDEDPKERAELAMIVDVERNDLGRVAEVGTVEMTSAPRVVAHRTVHHRVADLEAKVREGVTRAEVIAAMLPSGSVTGAPKVRAMEVIRSLEPRRRGLYTGGIGYYARDGSLSLAMAIRTLVFEGDEGEYWTGGGIVEGSDPDREVEETRWKAVQLSRA